MTSVNIQFHMLLEEAICFVAEVMCRYEVDIELERWFPDTTALIVANSNIAKEIQQFGDFDRIWIIYRSTRSNKIEKFMWNVGHQRGARLQQSQFGAEAISVGAGDLLKRIARDLKACTSAGIWVTSTTGETSLAKSFRYSPGVAAADRAGEIDLVNVAFTQSFHVDPPRSPSPRKRAKSAKRKS